MSGGGVGRGGGFFLAAALASVHLLLRFHLIGVRCLINNQSDW